jgi:hypothetical protein
MTPPNMVSAAVLSLGGDEAGQGLQGSAPDVAGLVKAVACSKDVVQRADDEAMAESAALTPATQDDTATPANDNPDNPDQVQVITTTTAELAKAFATFLQKLEPWQAIMPPKLLDEMKDVFGAAKKCAGWKVVEEEQR